MFSICSSVPNSEHERWSSLILLVYSRRRKKCQLALFVPFLEQNPGVDSWPGPIRGYVRKEGSHPRISDAKSRLANSVVSFACDCQFRRGWSGEQIDSAAGAGRFDQRVKFFWFSSNARGEPLRAP